MLRLVVLVLMLLNVGYFAWNEGWLHAYGWAPAQQREPERMAQQINPQALTLAPSPGPAPTASSASPAPPSSAPAPDAPAPVALQCLQSNVLDGDAADVLRPLLQSQFEPDAWLLQEQRTAPHWLIYMGKFASKAEQSQKRAQLADLKIKFEPVGVAELTPGYSLGMFTTQKAASDALALLAKRGVRSARLVQVQDTAPSYRLQLKSADPSQPAVQALVAALPQLKLAPCAPVQEP